MTKKHFLTPYLASAGILLISSFIVLQNANATGFLPQDARALAMGGSSVAVGNSRQAHYYNPSLLVNAPEDQDFNYEIDVALRFSDSDKLIQSAQDFESDKSLEKLATSIAALNDPLDTTAPATKVQNVVDSSRLLQTGIQDITGKSFTFDGNAGTFASVPNMNIANMDLGFAVYVNLWSNIGIQGNLNPADNALMDSFINVGEGLLTGGAINPADITTLANADPSSSLLSTVTIQGAAIVEYGFTIAKKQTINNYDLDIGITPKLQQVTTFGDTFSLNEIENEFDPFSQDGTSETTSFNIDLGISKELDDHWTTGLVIKNLIPYSYDIKNVAQDVEISPSARIGAAWKNNWVSAGADLDITKNQDIASLSETQFLSLGAELDVWILQLRGGYRHNLAGDGGSGISAGLGLYLAGLNIDAAVASNSLDPSNITEADNLNASVQLGFNW